MLLDIFTKFLRWISYLSTKAGAKTGGFRLLGSGFRTLVMRLELKRVDFDLGNGFRGFRLSAIHFFSGFRALQQNIVDFDF